MCGFKSSPQCNQFNQNENALEHFCAKIFSMYVLPSNQITRRASDVSSHSERERERGDGEGGNSIVNTIIKILCCVCMCVCQLIVCTFGDCFGGDGGVCVCMCVWLMLFSVQLLVAMPLKHHWKLNQIRICCVRDNFNWNWVIYIYYAFFGWCVCVHIPLHRNSKKQLMKFDETNRKMHAHKNKPNWIV